MSKRQYPLSLTEFNAIYSKVPRLTVELIVRTHQGVVIARLPRQYSKSEQWYLPGGTVQFKEKLTDAVRRVAKDELNIRVSIDRLLGYIEYPELNAAGYEGWPIGIAFEATPRSGTLTNDDQGNPLGYVKEVPYNMLEDQRQLLLDYLSDNPYSLL